MTADPRAQELYSLSSQETDSFSTVKVLTKDWPESWPTNQAVPDVMIDSDGDKPSNQLLMI